MRGLPLFIKWLAIAISFGITAEKTTTAMITNLGPVKVPEEMLPYIESYVMMPSPASLTAQGSEPHQSATPSPPPLPTSIPTAG